MTSYFFIAGFELEIYSVLNRVFQYVV